LPVRKEGPGVLQYSEKQAIYPGDLLMRKAGVGIALAWVLVSAAGTLPAQEKDTTHHYGKAGLWEVTTNMTWQQSPVKPGTPGGPPAAGSHATRVCLTQAMVDAGALFPQSRGECHIQNKVVKPGSLTANYLCTGKMKGMGNLESTFPDLEHVNGTIHFLGTLEMGQKPQPIEWTTTSTAVFKTAQCTAGPSAAPIADPAASK
jgi:Protein of unknown function (DUF3617)